MEKRTNSGTENNGEKRRKTDSESGKGGGMSPFDYAKSKLNNGIIPWSFEGRTSTILSPLNVLTADYYNGANYWTLLNWCFDHDDALPLFCTFKQMSELSGKMNLKHPEEKLSLRVIKGSRAVKGFFFSPSKENTGPNVDKFICKTFCLFNIDNQCEGELRDIILDHYRSAIPRTEWSIGQIDIFFRFISKALGVDIRYGNQHCAFVTDGDGAPYVAIKKLQYWYSEKAYYFELVWLFSKALVVGCPVTGKAAARAAKIKDIESVDRMAAEMLFNTLCALFKLGEDKSYTRAASYWKAKLEKENFYSFAVQRFTNAMGRIREKSDRFIFLYRRIIMIPLSGQKDMADLILSYVFPSIGSKVTPLV